MYMYVIMKYRHYKDLFKFQVNGLHKNFSFKHEICEKGEKFN